MLDIQLIRENHLEVQAALAKRGVEVDFTAFLARDRERRRLIGESEELRAERNRTSAEIPRRKRAGEDAGELLERMRHVADRIRELEAKLAVLEGEQQAFLDELPNLPAADVPAGGKEANEVVSVWGSRPDFNFEPLDHIALAESLHLVDYVRGAKLAGAGNWVYTGLGARLEWALLNYFMDRHLKDGYHMLLLPHLLVEECGYTAGQFPKFHDDVFRIDEGEEGGRGRFLLPTAETALVNLHRDEILEEAELPLRYFAYTPCYRKEAGSYRADERGMIRGHQFNKVEMFQYTTPEGSPAAYRELVRKAAALVEGLGLHHRVSRLAAGDVSASMAETMDIEVWLPSMNDYKEVSSASNAREYQARRGRIRYRAASDGKPRFVHTLNASGLATSRILPAILEQFQTRDGRVAVPEVLYPWMGDVRWLEP
ncbi:MAG: serine--tRNA ligase [Bacillota bacterium]|nr:serine--tRNA ligase [Bacillota bacterium]